VPTGLLDGPLPTHYEPHESPVQNVLYPKHQMSPVHKVWSAGKAWNRWRVSATEVPARHHDLPAHGDVPQPAR